MQLNAVAPFGFKDFAEQDVLPFIREIGIEVVHVVRDYQVKYSPAVMLKMLNDHGICAGSFHAEFGEHVDLSAESPVARQQAVDLLTHEAEVALGINVQTVIAHSAGRKDPYHPSRSANLRKGLETLAAAAEKLAVTYMIENMPPDHAYGVDAALLATDIQSIGSQHLGLCFDTGHAHMRNPDVAMQLKSTDGFVHYLHVHDNDGTDDQHLLPFGGKIDWQSVGQVIGDIKYDGTICLEVFEPVDVMRQKLTSQWWDGFYDIFGCRAPD